MGQAIAKWVAKRMGEKTALLHEPLKIDPEVPRA